MVSSHGWRKHTRGSVALTIVLFSALCLGLILALASCAPAATAPAAPAAEPTKAVEAEKPAGEQPAPATPEKCQSVPETTIRFGAPLSTEEAKLIQAQVDAFMQACPAIKVNLEIYDPSADPMARLQTEIAGGTPPDVIGVWAHIFSRLASMGAFIQLDGMPPDYFMKGAEKAGQVDGVSYALAWSRYLCTPVYRVLGISAQTKGKDASRLLIDYLTEAAQQESNFKNQMENPNIAPDWYPTAQSVNKDLAGCQDNDEAAKWPTAEQQLQIREKIEPELQALEDNLKDTIYWPKDQPTVFNFDGTTGLGIPDQDDKNQYAVVQAGAVPVISGDEQFFLEANLRQYAKGKGTTHVTVGGLRVYDPSALYGALKEGTYAVVWEYTVDEADDKMPIVAERLIFVDMQGEVIYTGQLGDLNGKVDAPGDPRFQTLQPWVVAEGDASWLDWLYDSRWGKVP